MEEDLVDSLVLAARLGKPLSWIRWAVRKRVIPYIRIGQQVRFRMSEIDLWLAERAVPTAGGARRRS